jgi:glyoxylase-like metal-dependent hydrolase (beta-lactamase superfamily II)
MESRSCTAVTVLLRTGEERLSLRPVGSDEHPCCATVSGMQQRRATSAREIHLMSEDIPFNRKFDLAPGVVEQVVPGIRRVLCDNPSPFTFKGTVSYIVGEGRVAIVDPGPNDERHVRALLDAVRNETVTHLVITHTHRDHSPAAKAIKAATGAPTYAEGPHRASRPLNVGETNRLEASGDMEFRPDVTLADGAVVPGDGWTLEAVTTPGHTANHMAFAFKEANALFVGDHVMGWSTPIVAPPDGAMSDYMASLRKLAERSEDLYLPGHGPEIRKARRFVQHYIRHRQSRENSILHRLGKGEADIPTIVRAIYIGLDPRLIGAAGLSVLAHLEDLVGRGLVQADGGASLAASYRLAGVPRAG